MDELIQAIEAMSRGSIRLTVQGPAEDRPGATRFGGVPDVPADFVWPVFETATWDDDEVRPRPLAFLAQFDCRELAFPDREGLLPHQGVLSFFYELGSQRWGFDPADADCARVFWFPAEGLAPAAVPEDLAQDCRFPALGISMEPERSYPFCEDFYAGREDQGNDWEAYWTARSALCPEEPDEACSRLLGWPDLIQGSFFRECELTARGYYLGSGLPGLTNEDRLAEQAAPRNWTLLLQLGTVTGEEFELMFGDCGRVYFCIRNEDLAARRFDRVWLILQCG